MPVDFAGFDASVKATEKLRKACEALGLDEAGCRKLEGYVAGICGERGGGRGIKAPRVKSRWQECIAKERKGKPFDPQAMRELSKLYKAGKCP